MVVRLALDCLVPLFVPADRPDRFPKAAASRADALILDLEDAVPAGSKALARAALRADFTTRPVIVRINGAATRWHDDDVAAVADLPLAALMLPKAEFGPTLDKVLSGPAGRFPVIALIETAHGLAQARNIAALPKVVRLAFGSIDYCADLGCGHGREALLGARSELVLASRLAGLSAPLDGVTTAIVDERLITDDARHASSLGFGGKLCIHPRQIEPALAGFRVAPGDLAAAREILASGDGVVAVEGQMVDEPVRARARALLARAAATGADVT